MIYTIKQRIFDVYLDLDRATAEVHDVDMNTIDTIYLDDLYQEYERKAVRLVKKMITYGVERNLPEYREK
jgi:hypothetical protein